MENNKERKLQEIKVKSLTWTRTKQSFQKSKVSSVSSEYPEALMRFLSSFRRKCHKLLFKEVTGTASSSFVVTLFIC
jgi:hypothetical protein